MTSNDITAAILIIGNEILSGRTQDANTQFIASRLSKRGVRLCEVRVVRDIKEDIIEATHALRKKYRYVFTTGGIGPTHDDITADCIAEAFGTAIDVNSEARAILKKYYDENGTEMNEARLRMARIPHGATLIHNPVSAAPGFKIGNVFVMAGVPKIMQSMFDHVETMIESGPPVLSNSVTCNLREGDIADGLARVQNDFPDIEIGSYPGMGVKGHNVSVVLRGTDETRLAAATEQVITVITDKGGEPRAVALRS